jgi:hypothetical protein
MQDSSRKSRSPERSFLRRDTAVRRPVRVSRPGGHGGHAGQGGQGIPPTGKLRRNGDGVVAGVEAGSDSGIDEGYGCNNGVRGILQQPPQQQAVAAGREQQTTGTPIDPLSRTATVGLSFPHYEVAEGRQQGAPTDSSVLLQEIEETLALTGSSHTLRPTPVKNASQGDLHDTSQLDTDALRRHIDARRSYNTRKKNTAVGIAILPNRSLAGKVQSVDNLDQCGEEMARPPSAASSALHPGDTKGPGSTRSSIVGPILDIEPPERMIGMLGERKKSNMHRGAGGAGAVGSSKTDPGISNSTHMLLQSKMNTQFFSFPNISAAEQRRAGCTPRAEGTRTHSRSPPRANRPRRTPGPAEKRPSEQPPPQAPVAKEASTVDAPVTRAGAKSRYSRMIALGLPKVNIDIDRNHFSRQSLKRRSLQLRERYDMPERGATEGGSTVSYQATPAASQYHYQGNDDMQVESVVDTQNEQESTIVWSSILDDGATSHHNLEITRVTDVNKPLGENLVPTVQAPTSTVPTGPTVNGTTDVPPTTTTTTTTSSVRLDKRHAQRSHLSSSAKKEPVGVSYYKMGPPGLEQAATSPRFPRHAMENTSAPTR